MEAANGGSVADQSERLMRRSTSPLRVSDAQADEFLRMREENHQAEQVLWGACCAPCAKESHPLG